VRDAAGLRAAPATGPILGTFDAEHLPFSLDRAADPALAAAVPSLAEMARAALSRLSANARGFVLQIEGGRVDHAAHSNDIGALIHDQLAFDDAVGVALEFATGRDDTLVLITSDHGNSNPGLNGAGGSFTSRGGSYGDTQDCFDRVARFRQTNVWTLAGLGPESTATQIRERVHTATELALEGDEIEMLRQALRKEHPRRLPRAQRPAHRLRADPRQLHLRRLDRHPAHHRLHRTGGLRPRSEEIGCRVQNTALFATMTRALGLTVPT
jgi:alkaline phosphatase